MRRLLPALLLALLLPASATADPPWSPVVDVSKPHQFVRSTGVALAGDGTAIAAWGWQDGTKFATSRTGSAIAFRAADGSWAPERAVRGAVNGPPVPYGAHAFK